MTHHTTSPTPFVLPGDGAVIVFTVVPCGSWATAGETYRVERQGRNFRFQNVRTGSATFDRDWAVARSVWHPAPISTDELRTELESLISNGRAA